jgi:hypothetical protein
MMALCKQSSDLYDENPAQAHIIAHSFTILLAPRTFRPALPVVLTTLAILFCCPLAHAESRPAAGASTQIVAVERLVQAINGVQEDEVLTLEN